MPFYLFCRLVLQANYLIQQTVLESCIQEETFANNYAHLVYQNYPPAPAPNNLLNNYYHYHFSWLILLIGKCLDIWQDEYSLHQVRF